MTLFMLTIPTPDIVLAYARSARGDLRWWGLLLVGMIFIWAGIVVDPRANCDAAGDCAPWLVPIAFGMGVAATMAAALQLMINPRRGSHVDLAAGDLLWWEGRVKDGRNSAAGRLPLARIARVRIQCGSDSDSLFLYGHDGALLPFPDGEVVPWPYQYWAARLAEHVPGLVIDEVGD